jgi:oligopeptide/dipeptide ABC transporter ATP-binding protein
MSETLLRVRGLTKHFRLKPRKLLEKPPALKAVDGIDFDVAKGETLGLVGESGCGKTTAARLVLRLIEPTAGEVNLDGVDILRCSRTELQQHRREMQLVFQDPVSSLNPRMSVGTSIAEPLRFHRIDTKPERYARVRQYLEVVGLSADYFDRLPHEFSGGQAQRVGIARALILRPKLLILDEPVSALDVSIRAQILNLLRELQAEFGLTYVFISHDLSVIKRVCDHTAVLYLGKIVEIAESERLYREPLHPYTRALIQAIPIAVPGAKSVTEMGALQGDVPSPINPPKGCAFHTRCPHAMERCREEEPGLRDAGAGHRVACFLHHGA